MKTLSYKKLNQAPLSSMRLPGIMRSDRRAFRACFVLFALVLMPCGCRDSDIRESASTASTGKTAHTDSESEAPEPHGDDHVEEIRLTPQAVEQYGITIERATLKKLRPTFVAPARVAFNAEAIAHVGSTLSGRVMELAVRLGDKVNAGDVLCVVESPQLGQAQSEYLQKIILADAANATVDLAQNGLSRATGLYEQNRGIALDEVQKREVEYKVAQAQVLSAEATAVAAENTLYVYGMTKDVVEALRKSGAVDPRISIVAPISGEIVEREVTLGELVSPQREKLMVIANIETLWVLADVTGDHLSKLALGAKAWINAGSLDTHEHEGHVSYVAPMIDPRTRTVSVRVAVECDDRSLKPGMFVSVRIEAADQVESQKGQVVAVSESAIQLIEGHHVVFVPKADSVNTFVARRVRVGEAVGEFAPVLAGLHEDESYVATGSFVLKADLGKSSAEHSH
jgi:cobalt-zinc-cadmium efflux system membrane fusion protein